MVDLQGLVVLNTRPEGQNQTLNQAIIAAGGRPLSCPLIEIVPLKESWLASLPDLNKVQQAIFISANAVEQCFSVFLEQGLAFPPQIQVIAIGAATAKCLQAYQVSNITIPEITESEGLLALPSLQVVYNQTILLFKGEGGLTRIADTLKNRGADLIALDVYKRRCPKSAILDLKRWQMAEAIDIILFTSEEALGTIFALSPGDKEKDRIRQTAALVISKRLAAVAVEFGIQRVFQCRPDNILYGLEQYNQGRIHGNK